MFRLIARILGPIMMANAVFDFAFPEFGSRFFSSGPGKNWRPPLRDVFQNIGRLSPMTRRYLAVWEGLIGALLFALASEAVTAPAMPGPRVRQAGPVRVPIEHVHH